MISLLNRLKSSILRSLRRPDFMVLTAAVAVAVAASTTVGFYTDRLERGIQLESATVLAADLRFESGRSAADLQSAAHEARRRGLTTATTTTLVSVVHAQEDGQLATVLAADAGYPLRGHLRVGTEPYGPAADTNTLPSIGEAYADPRLSNRLNISVGSIVRMGAVSLKISGILADRPDRGSGFAELAPALLVHPADLAASRLIGATSRATFALLVAGAPNQVAPFRTWLQQHKAAAERLIDVSQSSAQLGNAADRAGRFLHLSAVTTVLLAAIALAMAARRYALQRRTEVALLKCLGATRWTVLRRFAAELGVAAGLGGAIGVAIGAVTQWGLAQIAAVFTGLATLPAPGSMPAFLGLLTAAAMVAGFGLPPVMELTRVPPARVLREDAGARAFPLLYPAGAALTALLIILYLDIRDLQLIGGAALALAVVLVVYGLLAVMVVSAAARIRSDASRIWRYAAAALARRRIQSIAQLVAFSLGLTLLLLIGIVRGDLMTEWRHAVPADAPNYFLLNVDPAEREAVSGFFAAHGAPTEFAPWVRGRLQSINGIPVGNRLPPTERGRAFAEREQNLSFSAQLPRDNQLLEGQWWTSVGPTEPSVSVASEFRDELGLRLGDRLVFDIAGEPIELKVSSIRRVRWDGFRPNFFLLVSPGALDDRVGSYLGAAHIDASARQSLGLFSRQFPTVTALDLDGVLTTVRRLIDRAAAAVTYVFAFTLFAGLVVIQAAIRSTADERKFEGALLRALGASRGRVLAGAVTEFALLGLLAGLSASVCAALIGKIIAAHWLGIPWLPGWSLWLWGPGAGCALVGSGGAVGTWIMGMTPPGSVFRGN